MEEYNQQNVFFKSEEQFQQQPPNMNNCNGHFTSIQAGGNGHYSGDGCGCDGIQTTVGIDGFLIPLFVAGIILILKFKR